MAEFDPKSFCSTAEAADLLDVRRQYVTSLIRSGKLAAVKLTPRLIVIPRDEVRRYLREQRQFRMGGPRNDGSDYRSQHGDGDGKKKPRK